MTKLMLIDAVDAEETRIAITDNGDIDHFDFISKSKAQIKGNIYLGKITRIEPSLQAAFVEYGGNKQGFLPFSEIHPDYYQIPVEDRKRLLEEAEAAAAAEDAQEHAEDEDDKPTPKRTRRKRGNKRNTSDTNTKKADDADNNASADKVSTSDNATGDDDAGRKSVYSRRRVNKKPATYPTDKDDTVIAEASIDDASLNKKASESKEATSDTDERQPPSAAQEQHDTAPSDKDEKPTRARRTSRRRKPKARDNDDASTQEPTLNDGNSEQVITNKNDSDDDDDIEAYKGNSQAIYRKYKIQEVMRPGQLLLIQVVKEERGNKGVSLSTYISLAGRYCVLMPNSPKGGGISRKIANSEDRKRLRQISKELKESRGMNAIIRTAGIDRTRAEIKRDYEYLIKLWNQIREEALSAIAPAVVHEENNLIKRSIRDFYDGEIENIFVEGDVTAYKQAKEFMRMLMPSHAPRVKHYKDAHPIFTHHHIESQLSDLYNPIAPLPSGGYLVINPTEALISIDVNSGKSTNERNVEETAYKTNLEACHELARQLRLRNMGGLVVVDFIDMAYHKYRRTVERTMKEAFKHDRARIQVGSISQFGLMELSRQRMGASLEETTTQQCQHCGGTGKAMSAQAVVIQLLRNLQSYASDHNDSAITISLSQAVMIELCNNYRSMLRDTEAAFNVTITFELSDTVDVNSYSFSCGTHSVTYDKTNSVPKRRRSNSTRNKPSRRSKSSRSKDNNQSDNDDDNDADNKTSDSDSDSDSDATADNADKPARKRRSRGSRGGRKRNTDKRNDDAPDNKTDDKDVSSPVDTAEDAPSDEAPKRPRGRRKAAPATSPDNAATDDKQSTVSNAAPDEPKKQPAPTPVAVPKDTPAPKQRRKGWWSRVIDGDDT